MGVVYVPYGLYGEYKEYKNYTENGYTVSGEVTSAYSTGKHTYITVVYSDKNGTSHTEDISLPSKALPGIGSEQTLYLIAGSEDKPWVKPEPGDKALMLILSGILFLSGLSIPLFAVLSRKENKLLDAEGKAVTGTIIAAETNSNGYTYGVIFFQTERGEERAEGVPLKDWQRFGDDVQLEYAYDQKGKIHWRLK